MTDWYQYWPFLSAMAVLIGCSAFFSGSEAALFFLTPAERRRLESRGRASRMASALLADPDRLLTAVLFWNLLVNISYFALSSIVSIKMQNEGHAAEASAVALGSLLAIIVFSELLPKTLAVLRAHQMATVVGIPLTMAVRLVDPLIPLFRLVNVLSRRLVWPNFRPEPYLAVNDLERAVEISTNDAHLIEQEQTVLRNIVRLSEIRVDEVMRPRVQFLSFRPPVAFTDLRGRMTPSGYMLITETDSDEVVGAIALKELSHIPDAHLEQRASPVYYAPWSSTVSETMERLRALDSEVAVVVNEFGESIGILTMDDVWDSIFTLSPSRSERIMNREPVERVSDSVWHVTGMLTLRRLARDFQFEIPPSNSVTIAGVLHEALERLPTEGDECEWGPFVLRVLEVPDRGQSIIEMRRVGGEVPDR